MSSYSLNGLRALSCSQRKTKRTGMVRMSKKLLNCVIEVDVPSGPEGWQVVVNERMKQELDKLKSVIKELGGQVRVRY